MEYGDLDIGDVIRHDDEYVTVTGISTEAVDPDYRVTLTVEYADGTWDEFTRWASDPVEL